MGERVEIPADLRRPAKRGGLERDIIDRVLGLQQKNGGFEDQSVCWLATIRVLRAGRWIRRGLPCWKSSEGIHPRIVTFGPLKIAQPSLPQALKSHRRWPCTATGRLASAPTHASPARTGRTAPDTPAGLQGERSEELGIHTAGPRPPFVKGTADVCLH